ncbi:MAG: hypothetical protein ACLR6W_11440 [Evtepia sp.]
MRLRADPGNPAGPVGVGSADQEDTTPSEGMTATASQDYRVTPGGRHYTVTLDGAQVGGSAWIPTLGQTRWTLPPTLI